MGLVIQGGIVFDPSSNWDGEVRDLFIAHGRVVDHLTEVDEAIDARGLAVTPAALELRSPVAGYGQNFLRLWGGLPSPRELGESYALLGYTHIHEPDLTLLTANYVHRELAAIPLMDTSASLTLNLRDFDIFLKNKENLSEVAAAWAYLLEHCGGLTLRVAEPFVRYRQEFYQHRTISLEAVLDILDNILHILDSKISLEATPELLTAGLPSSGRFHLACLGPALVNPEALEKAHRLLAAGVSADMGLLPPAPRSQGSLVPLTIDQDRFAPCDLHGSPDPEAPRRALELALHCRQANLAFSAADLRQTPVSSFPQLFSWLCDHHSRRRFWGEDLAPCSYSLHDWLRSTRSLPAQHLGLPDRGHLRPGARADVSIYDLPTLSWWPQSFNRCRMLLKAGERVVDNYEIVNHTVSKATFYRRTGALPNHIIDGLYAKSSFRPGNLRVHPNPEIHWQKAP